MGTNPFETDEPVYFKLGDTGEEVSNDPRYHEAKYMENVLEKIENTGKATRDEADLHRELGTGSPVAPHTGRDVEGLGDEDDDDNDELLEQSVDDMSVKELKEHVAALREAGVEVDTEGVTKKSELVKAIKAATKNA